ncbi:hypothetical protein DBV08_18210 [Rhodococcus sp. KBW08]|nr:hypothetical protein DBV08_18210 [Rhodococcus sp. KBW08]
MSEWFTDGSAGDRDTVFDGSTDGVTMRFVVWLMGHLVFEFGAGTLILTSLEPRYLLPHLTIGTDRPHTL